jgi:hypothetical protein
MSTNPPAPGAVIDQTANSKAALKAKREGKLKTSCLIKQPDPVSLSQRTRSARKPKKRRNSRRKKLKKKAAAAATAAAKSKDTAGGHPLKETLPQYTEETPKGKKKGEILEIPTRYLLTMVPF